MKTMPNIGYEIVAWLRNERGSNGAEYALLIGFIAVAIAISVGLVGTNLNLYYLRIAEGLADALGL